MEKDIEKLQLKSPFDSLQLDGEAMHLSTTYREEHLSGWLGWVLGLRTLKDDDKIAFYKIFLPRIKGSIPVDELGVPVVQLEVPIPITYESNDERAKRLDVVIRLGKTTLIIEVKHLDTHVWKNMHYKKYIDGEGKDKFPGAIPVLLIPQDTMADLPEKNPEHEEEATKDALEAFPPITWERFIGILRETMKEFSDVTPPRWDEWLAWIILTNSFIGFIEGEIIGFNLKAIKNAINSGDNALDIAELDSYITYRRMTCGKR